MLKPLMITSLISVAVIVSACKPGYNRIYDNSDPDDDKPDCADAPINNNASDKTKEVFRLIADLSCDRIENYVLVGQSLGAGDQIADSNDDNHSYDALIDDLFSSTNKRPAVISIDYEAIERFDETALDSANQELITHANNDGIISITWTPTNPWKSDTNQLPLAPTTQTDLSILYGSDDGSDAWSNFDTQLKLVASQLKKLSDQEVPVLFAPFPEMNTPDRWYGDHKDNSATNFEQLWNHVYSTINAESPTNLIWVYAPRSGNITVRENATWGYPGESRIDVVAGIAFTDDLAISDYNAYVELNKPIGMTRLAPSGVTNGQFDNELYVRVLHGDYKQVAYWIADHDTPVTNEDPQKRSIISNLKSRELMNNANTATIDTIRNEDWLDLQ